MLGSAGKESYIVALDQGTTSSRAILFDHAGGIAAVAQREFGQIFPKPGWVEHDPMEILSSQLGVLTEVMVKADVDVSQIAALGITNQRETVIVWDRHTGRPVYNAIVWQCRRTAKYIDSIVAQGVSREIAQKTGLVPDAYFSASKIRWVLENVPGVREAANRGDVICGTVDTWLIWNLTGGKVHATDYTNASRTMLFNIHELEWDEGLLEMFGIPRQMLPSVVASSGVIGETSCDSVAGEIPIAGIAGDQQAALFGQCCFEPGQLKNTYGTGGFLLMNTGDAAVSSESGLLTTIAAGAGDRVQYALEGSVFVAGAAIQWLRDQLGIIRTAAETSDIASGVPSSDGVYVVPAFTGLGAPYWDPYARGAILGITRGTTAAHIVRATLESLAYLSSDVIRTMQRDAGLALSELKVDGGASRNDFLMQFQADILGCDVVRPKTVETTALGAAYLAGLAVGYWGGLDEVRRNWALDQTFAPKLDDARRDELLAGWSNAVSRTLAH